MPKLRRLSGPEVVNILGKFGFMIFSQIGYAVERGEKIALERCYQLRCSLKKAIFLIPRFYDFTSGGIYIRFFIPDVLQQPVKNALPVQAASNRIIRHFVDLPDKFFP